MNLLDRLKKTKGPDRELDARIQCQLQGFKFLAFDDSRGHDKVTYEGPSNAVGAVLRYTDSIEAALTLVSDDFWWLIGRGQITPGEPLYGAQIRKPGFSTGGQVVSEAEHDCMPIALCIAAIKARTPDDL